VRGEGGANTIRINEAARRLTPKVALYEGVLAVLVLLVRNTATTAYLY